MKRKQKRICSFVLILCMVCNLFAGLPVSVVHAASDVSYPQIGSSAETALGTAAVSADGTSLEDASVEVLEISTSEAFAKLCDPETFANINGKKIVLTDDIDLSGIEMMPIGAGVAFTGVLDGQGHVIQNLTITSEEDNTGLFSYVGRDGQILNLGLVDVNVTGGNNTGAIAGCLVGTVDGCYITGTVNGTGYTGGIAGMLHAGTIKNCYVDASVTGTNSCGVLFGGTGHNTGNSLLAERITEVSHVVDYNLMLGSISGTTHVGGMFGDMSGGTYGSVCGSMTGNVILVDSVTAATGYYSQVYGYWSSASNAQIPGTPANAYSSNMVLNGTGAKNDPLYKEYFTAMTTDELSVQSAYENMGWNFDSVWIWDADNNQPMLKVFVSEEEESEVVETLTIHTAQELAALCNTDIFASISKSTILLANDIDMKDVTFTPIGGREAFNGIFDGQGYVIKNLTIESETDCTGFFAYVGRNGQIKNLSLENVYVTGKNNTGSITGCLSGSIIQCSVTGTVMGDSYTGGITGILHAGTIENCWSNVFLTTNGGGGSLFGGTSYLGLNKAGSPIAERIADKKHVVKNNLTLGRVEGSGYVGGMLGDYSGSTYGSMCETFTGNVLWLNSVNNGSNAGGKVYGFWSTSANVQIPTTGHENVYWAEMSSNNSNNLTYANFTARTTEELKTQSVYEALGWDFAEIWTWSEERGHPVLKNVTVPAFPEPVYQKTPASLVSTYAGDAKTTRAFTWYTDIVVTDTVLQAVPADRYTDVSDFDGEDAISVTGTSRELPISGQGEMRCIHQVRLTGLTAGTSYCYRVGDGGENWSSVYTFTTEPESTDTFTFYSIADTQSGNISNTVNYKNYKYILEIATEENPEGAFIFHAGDVIQNNLTSHYDAVYDYVSEYTPWLPSMVTSGNHETEKDWSKEEDSTYGVDNPNYVKGTENFNSHYLFPDNGPEGANQMIYSFDYGNAHFAVLNSSTKTSLPMADQVAWLREDMNASDKTWKIVSIHVGPYNSYGKGSAVLCDAMDELGIDLVLFGHNHIFMRSNPIYGSVVGKPGDEGTIYYSSGSAGGSGTINEKGAPWFEATLSIKQPTYGVIQVSSEAITVETRTINTLSLEDGSELLDTYTITLKKNPEYTAPTANVLKDTETVQELLVPGTAVGGTMVYSLDSENWYETVPTADTAGTYDVWYKVLGDEEHLDTVAECITVIIEPKNIQEELVLESAVNLTIGETLPLQVKGGTLENEILYTVTNVTGEAVVEDGVLVPIKAGIVTVQAFLAGNEDYYGVSSEVLTVVIYENTAEEIAAAKLEAQEARAKAEAAEATAKTAQAEAEAAKAEAEAARVEAENAKTEAETAKAQAENAKTEAEAAKAEAEAAKAEAKAVKAEAEAANAEAKAAKAEVEAVKAELAKVKAEAGRAKAEAELAKIEAETAKNEGALAKEEAEKAKAEAEAAAKAAQEALERAEAAQKAAEEALKKIEEEQKEINCPSKNFTDVEKDVWYHEAVDYVLANNLMNGFDDTTFAPNYTLTRAMMVQIIYNMEGKPESTSGNKFADIAEDAWYYQAVTWAAQQGIVSGYTESTFGPEDAITREQLVTIFWRYAGYPRADSEEILFDDAQDVDGYAEDAVLWAVDHKIVSGMGNNLFAPDNPSTRAEAAKIMQNCCMYIQ